MIMSKRILFLSSRVTEAARALPAWIPLFISGMVFLSLSLRFWSHTVDDAFISFRYARNLAQGLGLVFNPGERVEGYTNFLWVLLGAAAEYLGGSPEVVAKVIGLVCGLGTMLAVAMVGSRDLSKSHFVWIPLLFLAVNPPFTVWATAGLETPLFTLLITLAVLLVAAGVEKARTDWSGAVLLGLSALTRPEGVLVAATVSAILLWHVYRRNMPIRSWLVWNLLFLMISLPYFAWRYEYYGALFPNTYYAKVEAGTSQTVRGLAYAHNYLKSTGYWLLPLLVGVRWVSRKCFTTMISAVVLVFSFYIVLVGGDGLPMYRFFVPISGLLFVLLAQGMQGLYQKFRARRLVLTATVVFMVFALAWSSYPAFTGSDHRTLMIDNSEVATWREVGLWFREQALPNESIAVVAAGAIPYFSGLRTLDMLGLLDPVIARRDMPGMGRGQAGHEKYDIDHVLAWNPTYVIVGTYNLTPELRRPTEMIKAYYPAELELLKSLEFHRAYRSAWARTKLGYFSYFVRRTI
jgi:arabinofuranosyltransferase